MCMCSFVLLGALLYVGPERFAPACDQGLYYADELKWEQQVSEACYLPGYIRYVVVAILHAGPFASRSRRRAAGKQLLRQKGTRTRVSFPETTTQPPKTVRAAP